MVTLTQEFESKSFANAIVESAVCLNLRMSAWGNTGKIDKNLVEVEGNKRRMKFTKTLLECSELKAIQQHDSQMRKYAAGTSIPAPFKRGIYLIRQDAADMVDRELTRMTEEREWLIDRLCNVLDQLIEEQRQPLGSTFDERDYPTVEELSESYSVVWYFFDPNPARALTAGVTPEQLRQAEGELRDRVRTGFDEIRGQLDSMMVDMPRRMVSFDED